MTPTALLSLVAFVGLSAAEPQVGDDHLDRSWGPLVGTLSTRPSVSAWSTVRRQSAFHAFNGLRVSVGRALRPYSGVWAVGEVTRLVWAVPDEGRSGVRLDHVSGAVGWGVEGDVGALVRTGWTVEGGFQVGSNELSVVRTLAVERLSGLTVATHVWMGRELVTFLLGAGNVSGYSLGGWASVAVAVDVADALAVQLAMRTAHRGVSESFGLAWSGATPLRGSVSALRTRTGRPAADSVAGPWMLHLEVGWVRR